MARDAQIQMRRDTAANWTSVNPTLAAGEWGLETDTFYVKIGDGTTAWTSLPYERTPFLGSQGASGNWWQPYLGAVTTDSPTTNILQLVPMFMPRPVSVSTTMVNCSTGVAGTSLRVGVYQHDTTTGAPKLSTAPLFEITSGSQFSLATTGVPTVTNTVTIPGGWSWLGYVQQGVGGAAVRATTYALQNLPFTLNTTTAPTTTTFQSAANGFTGGTMGAALTTITALTPSVIPPMRIFFKTT